MGLVMRELGSRKNSTIEEIFLYAVKQFAEQMEVEVVPRNKVSPLADVVLLDGEAQLHIDHLGRIHFWVQAPCFGGGVKQVRQVVVVIGLGEVEDFDLRAFLVPSITPRMALDIAEMLAHYDLIEPPGWWSKSEAPEMDPWLARPFDENGEARCVVTMTHEKYLEMMAR